MNQKSRVLESRQKFKENINIWDCRSTGERDKISKD